MNGLHEILNVRQTRGEPRRRWFQSDDLDLIVWCGEDGQPFGFQMCYDRGDDEHALTWNPESGFSHARVDSGDNFVQNRHKRAPVLVADGPINFNRLRRLLSLEGAAVPPEIFEFVRSRLSKPESVRHQQN